MSKKVISINPDFFKLTSGRKKQRKQKKQKPLFNIKPNNIRQKLIEKVKQHKMSQKQEQKQQQNNPETFNELVDNFNESINYLQQLSNKHKHKKQLRKHKKTLKRYNTPDPPPYGCLKNGKKPTYSQYKSSIKNKNSNNNISHINSNPTPPVIHTGIPHSLSINTSNFAERKNNLEQVKNAFNPDRHKKKKNTKIISNKKTKKIIHLGKNKGNVGILIRNKKTRKKIKREINSLHKKSLVNIKKYLKKHNLIKYGSNAPENLLRDIYVNSYLCK